jgi:hypothetical protein
MERNKSDEQALQELVELLRAIEERRRLRALSDFMTRLHRPPRRPQ